MRLNLDVCFLEKVESRFNLPGVSNDKIKSMKSDSIKLAAFLARAGIAARRRSEELILQGKVRVNGQTQTNVATRVVPGQDVVEYDGRVLELEEHKVLLALNKPRGVVSTVSDPDGKKTVIDFVPSQYRHLRLFPIGRLDEDSEGLILLTNDGEYAQQITHPRYEIEKEYRVTIAGQLSPAEVSRILRGVPLKDGTTKPAEVEVVKESGSTQTVDMTLREGRYHEIRRIMKALNHEVIRLQRRRIGPFVLGDLPSGQVREEAFTSLK